MPEIPGSNSVPGGNIPGGRSIPPRTAGNVGASAGAAGGISIPGLANPADTKTLQQIARFFGFHTEASLMARLASMGVSPTLGNLRIAQQLLRYGQPLEQDAITNMAQLWSQYGAGDVVRLEAMAVLQAQGLPINNANLSAMMQLLSGGPLSHLLARLTMAVKGENNPKLTGLAKKLTAFWQLGHLDKNLVGQLGQFDRVIAGVAEEAAKVESRGLKDETLTELGRLGDLFEAHKLLKDQSQNPAQYIPFFVWRNQQPFPGEILVQSEGGGSDGTGQFLRLTLAVETKNLGRIHVDITYMRDNLGVKFEVVEEKIKKLVDPRLVLLRQRLTAAPYMVDILACQATGQSRAVSALLPKRRDIKKLGRVHGMM